MGIRIKKVARKDRISGEHIFEAESLRKSRRGLLAGEIYRSFVRNARRLESEIPGALRIKIQSLFNLPFFPRCCTCVLGYSNESK